jgi:hypothetical protein
MQWVGPPCILSKITLQIFPPGSDFGPRTSALLQLSNGSSIAIASSMILDPGKFADALAEIEGVRS